MNELVAIPAERQAKPKVMEAAVRGRWLAVPALNVDGQNILVTGRWIKIASLHSEDWIEDELADPARCVNEFQMNPNAPRADILRFSQKVPDTAPRYKYPFEMRSIAVADISNFDKWWMSLPQETRKNVRRSQKRGVVIIVKKFDSDVIKGIAEVQNETSVRQGRPYPHYGKSLERVERDHGEFLDRSDFICAYFEDEFIGFLKLVYRGNVASLLQLNSKIAHYDKRPANALLTKGVELCRDRGIPFMTYGQFNYGNKGDNPLREFKERHGFAEMMLPMYYVPITALGRFCVKTKLYREPMEMLPRKLIRTAVSARAKWYSSFTQKGPV
jgi:hypothetical protein